MIDCIRCQIIRGEAPSFLIEESAAVAMFLSMGNYPLIVPKLHVADVFGLSPELGAKNMTMSVRIAAATITATGGDGIYINQTNGIAAGQSVFHYQMHICPK
jgi:histidine triad (HIT) family protein